jgi:hypothetical protein
MLDLSQLPTKKLILRQFALSQISFSLLQILASNVSTNKKMITTFSKKKLLLYPSSTSNVHFYITVSSSNAFIEL